MLPTMLLSGFIFPIDSMPRPLQIVSNVVPARWFVVIARGIMLKGVGLATLWQETLVLAGMALLLLGARRAVSRAAGVACAVFFLARAEVLHVMRDRATLAQIFVMPIVQLLVLSNAATFEVSTSPYRGGPRSHDGLRGLVQRLAGRSHFRVMRYEAADARADRALLAGDVTMVLTHSPRLREGSRPRGRAPRPAVVNAEKGSAAGIVQSYASRSSAPTPGTRTGRSRGWRRRGPRGSRRSISGRSSWYNPTLNYKHYMVPGAAGVAHHDDRTLLTRAEHRPREGAGHARAAQRHADHPRAVHRGQAAAVLDALADRSSRSASPSGGWSSTSRCAAACCWSIWPPST